MLQSFAVTNFRSFKERQEVTFHATADKSGAGTLLKHNSEPYLRVLGLFGANASGKSNLFKSMMVMRSVVLGKNSLGDRLPGMIPFRLDKTPKHETEFNICVEIDGAEYDYSFSACPARIHSETLYMKIPNGKRVLKYDRKSTEKGKPKWDIKGMMSNQDAEFLKKRTRDNMLFLSRAADENYEELGRLVLWFKSQLWIQDFSRSTDAWRAQTAQQMTGNEEFRRGVLTLLQDADFGISDIAIRDEPTPSVSFNIPAHMQSGSHASIPAMSVSPSVGVTTIRKNAAGNPVQFNFLSDESNGTQRFFGLIGMVLRALNLGACVVIDEIDCSLHPLLVRKIVEMFNDSKSNPKGAQLLFATHDVSLLESRLLRRDQMWFAEKSSGGSTSLFSLYDFGKGDDKPRKNEAFLKNYLQGMYGAVSNFGPSLEDMDIPCTPAENMDNVPLDSESEQF